MKWKGGVLCLGPRLETYFCKERLLKLSNLNLLWKYFVNITSLSQRFQIDLPKGCCNAFT